LDSVLFGLIALEARIIRAMNLPLGCTIIALAQKRGDAGCQP
jgi:hypothetical protein